MGTAGGARLEGGCGRPDVPLQAIAFICASCPPSELSRFSWGTDRGAPFLAVLTSQCLPVPCPSTHWPVAWAMPLHLSPASIQLSDARPLGDGRPLHLHEGPLWTTECAAAGAQGNGALVLLCHCQRLLHWPNFRPVQAEGGSAVVSASWTGPTPGQSEPREGGSTRARPADQRVTRGAETHCSAFCACLGSVSSSSCHVHYF